MAQFRLMCDYMATGLWHGVSGSTPVEEQEMIDLGLSEDTRALLKMWQRWYETPPHDEPMTAQQLVEWTLLGNLLLSKIQFEMSGHTVVLWMI